MNLPTKKTKKFTKYTNEVVDPTEIVSYILSNWNVGSHVQLQNVLILAGYDIYDKKKKRNTADADMLEKLKKIPGLIFYGSVDESKVSERLGVISFNVKDMPHALVSAILNYEGGIGVRNGCFCAHPYIKCLLGVTVEETKILEKKILSHDRSTIPGAVRISFGMYNTTDEVDQIIDILKIIAGGKYKGEYELFTKTGEYFPKNFEVDFNEYYKL